MFQDGRPDLLRRRVSRQKGRCSSDHRGNQELYLRAHPHLLRSSPNKNTISLFRERKTRGVADEWRAFCLEDLRESKGRGSPFEGFLGLSTPSRIENPCFVKRSDATFFFQWDLPHTGRPKNHHQQTWQHQTGAASSLSHQF